MKCADESDIAPSALAKDGSQSGDGGDRGGRFSAINAKAGSARSRDFVHPDVHVTAELSESRLDLVEP